MIGGKWCLLILCALHDRKSRTGELKRKLGGVSQKMLTQTLREMEEMGIVRRISYPEVPPRVEYELTELGISLAALIRNVEGWIMEHYPLMAAARQRTTILTGRDNV